MHQSIATIDSPEFINLQPLEINPLMSSCEIKVLYLGENRNHSFISKEVATEMAKTLRGAPIVGYYRKENEDFADHGQRLILDDEGIKSECLTKPYGFVAPDAKVWFQKFEDTDDFGNKIEREYLMTTGYLWTEQYEECKLAIDEGRPQSMELDEKTLDGKWSTNSNTGMDFFIINDAIFSKLCILGEEVEPCFEGSSVTAPEVSSHFNLIDDNFKNTLFNMMQELQTALEGGKNMEKEEEEREEVMDTVIEETVEEMDNSQQENLAENENSIEEEVQLDNDTDFAKKEDEEEDKEAKESDKEEKTDSEDDKEEDEDKKKKSYSLEEYEELQAKYSDLDAKYQALVAFKNDIDNEKKDALIASFYMLSEEEKADVIKNKANYSLDEIESKLSVICVRNRVSFDLEENKKEEQPITTFNLNSISDDANAPAWLSAVRNTKSNK